MVLLIICEKVYDRIRLLRKKYSDLPIEVDIGITEETAPLLVGAGATKLITGSLLLRSCLKNILKPERDIWI